MVRGANNLKAVGRRRYTHVVARQITNNMINISRNALYVYICTDGATDRLAWLNSELRSIDMADYIWIER